MHIINNAVAKLFQLVLFLLDFEFFVPKFKRAFLFSVSDFEVVIGGMFGLDFETTFWALEEALEVLSV